MTNLNSILKSRDYFTNRCLPCQSYGFPVVTYEYESWTIKKAECWRIYAFYTMVWEKILESPLDSKEIQPVNPKQNQPWMLIGRTDVEAEALILWSPDAKSWLIGKDPDTGKDWRQEEKETTEDEMVRWHHQLNGHEFKQTPGDDEGQGSLVCCSPCGSKVRHMTEQQQRWEERSRLYRYL